MLKQFIMLFLKLELDFFETYCNPNNTFENKYSRSFDENVLQNLYIVVYDVNPAHGILHLPGQLGTKINTVFLARSWSEIWNNVSYFFWAYHVYLSLAFTTDNLNSWHVSYLSPHGLALRLLAEGSGTFPPTATIDHL